MDSAPLVHVSARNKTGLDDLISTLTEILQNHEARPDLERARLPIDRVFSMSGFGTVVTGTLMDGQLALEDEIEILPGGARGRVRGLQSHKHKETRALPGSRTAVNISNIPTEQIQRGNVLAHPGHYQATRRLDATLRVLKDASTPVRHDAEIKLFVGASETMARLRVLDAEEIKPGEEGWIQLELRDPVVTVRGDRYILRRPSPGETLGGGLIVDHQPQGRHKRYEESILKSLASLAQGTPPDILFEAALTLHAVPAKELIKRSRLDQPTAESAIEGLLADGRLISLPEDAHRDISDPFIIALPHWTALRTKALQAIEAYHKSFPLRRGIPREELKSRLQLQPRLFNSAARKLVADNAVIEMVGLIGLPGHQIKFDPIQQAGIQALMLKFSENPFASPSIKESQREVGEEVFNALLEAGDLIAVSQDVVFRKQDYDSMVTMIQQTLQQNRRITLAEVRDLFNTSRKYAQAMLEHLDAIGITAREGDYRKLKIR
jgi:selenocysteine-specific elongation factor